MTGSSTMATIIANTLAFWMICVQFLALLCHICMPAGEGKASWELNIIFHSGWFKISKTSLMHPADPS